MNYQKFSYIFKIHLFFQLSVLFLLLELFILTHNAKGQNPTLQKPPQNTKKTLRKQSNSISGQESPSSEDLLHQSYLSILQEQLQLAEKIYSLQGRIQKIERINGSLENRENIAFQAKEGMIYMQWLSGKNYQRRLIYRPAKDMYNVWIQKGLFQNRLLQEGNKPRQNASVYKKNAFDPYLFTDSNLLFFHHLRRGFWIKKLLQKILLIVKKKDYQSLASIEIDERDQSKMAIQRLQVVLKNEILLGKNPTLRLDIHISRQNLLHDLILYDKSGKFQASYSFRYEKVNEPYEDTYFDPQARLRYNSSSMSP